MGEILLATESYIARAPQLANQILLNFFTEKQPEEAKAQWPLFTCPGIGFFKNTADQARPTGPCRGFVEWQDQTWGVFGSSLYRLDENGVAVWSGGGITGTRPVGLSENGVQIIIVNGVEGWTYDSALGLQKITDVDFYPSVSVTFIDGFFVLTRRGTNQWFISDSYDGRSYDPLQFASAEAAPGFITTAISNLQFIYIFTSTHIEIWYNAGSAPFPFQRYAGGVLPYGCISPYSVVIQDGAVWMIGRDRRVYRIDGNQIRPVSNPYIERLLENEDDDDLALAEVFTYTTQGHKFINITLVGQRVTVVYDATTGKWHNRDSVDAGFNELGRWRARFAVRSHGRLLVGDAFTGLLGQLDWETFREYDNPMRGFVRSLNQHKDRKRVFCKRLELDMQFGTGTSGLNADPDIRMRRSVDGGETFGGWQPPRSIGTMGEFKKRMRWLRQGQGREMMWEFWYTNGQPATVIQAHGDLLAGLN